MAKYKFIKAKQALYCSISSNSKMNISNKCSLTFPLSNNYLCGTSVVMSCSANSNMKILTVTQNISYAKLQILGALKISFCL